jgi:hypothetical protein
MQPVVVTFPDHQSLGQEAPAPRTPYQTPRQTSSQARLSAAQQQVLPVYLRRTSP